MKGMKLNERLDAFRTAMFDKFKQAEHKHRGESVMDDKIDWMSFNWRAINSHFWEEVRELQAAISNGDGNSVKDELVDVANMAFLLWWLWSNYFPDEEEAHE
jgi:hypothetical protein